MHCQYFLLGCHEIISMTFFTVPKLLVFMKSNYAAFFLPSGVFFHVWTLRLWFLSISFHMCIFVFQTIEMHIFNTCFPRWDVSGLQPPGNMGSVLATELVSQRSIGLMALWICPQFLITFSNWVLRTERLMSPSLWFKLSNVPFGVFWIIWPLLLGKRSELTPVGYTPILPSGRHHKPHTLLLLLF